MTGSAPQTPPDPIALVDDLLSRAPSRILGATWAIIGTRDDAALRAVLARLPELEAAVDDVDLGGMLASNGRHLEHAFDRVRLHAAGRCLCEAYSGHDMYAPRHEQARGHVTIVAEIPVVIDGTTWRPRQRCVCSDCGRRYDVEENEHHYPWWRWRRTEDVEAEESASVPTPRTVVTNPRSPARARRRRSSPSPSAPATRQRRSDPT